MTSPETVESKAPARVVAEYLELPIQNLSYEFMFRFMSPFKTVLRAEVTQHPGWFKQTNDDAVKERLMTIFNEMVDESIASEQWTPEQLAVLKQSGCSPITIDQIEVHALKLERA